MQEHFARSLSAISQLLNKAVYVAGDRTKDALLEFAEALVPSAGQPHRYIRGVTRMAKTPGCNLSGD